jgi:hypothetical protein
VFLLLLDFSISGGYRSSRTNTGGVSASRVPYWQNAMPLRSNNYSREEAG